MKIYKIILLCLVISTPLLCFITITFTASSAHDNKDFLFNLKLGFVNSTAKGYELIHDSFYGLAECMGFDATCSNCSSDKHSSDECSEAPISNIKIGSWRIPDVGVEVDLYNSSAQSVCDNKNSACYFSLENQFVIADHWYQGFNAIKLCQMGMKAYLDTGSDTQEYVCVGILKGHNKVSKLTDQEGNLISNPGGITLYTCNGSWENITLVLFQPV